MRSLGSIAVPSRKLGLVAALAAAGVLALPAVSVAKHVWVVVFADPGGKVPPKKPNSSSKKMKMSIAKRTYGGGDTVKLTAKRFKRSEYVSVWDFHMDTKRVRSQLGKNANRKGKLTYRITTFAGITPGGRHRICAKGERSKRVACASYTLKNPPLESDGDWEPPDSDDDSDPADSDDDSDPADSDEDY